MRSARSDQERRYIPDTERKSLVEQNKDRVALLSLGIAVPPYPVVQKNLARWMAEALQEQPALARWLARLYDTSGIETRYSCLPDEQYPPSESRFAPNRTLADAPTTSERMAIYEREAVTVGTAAARQALEDYCDPHTADISNVAASVTHLIVVSCTGFFAPGLDQAIARQLQLRPTVERTLIGFMGCAAAFNALRMAAQIVRAQPSARVLIVCVELCSLHIQPGYDRVNLVVASLFADGAAACLVGAPSTRQKDRFEILNFHSSIRPDSQSDMVWQIGNHGFTLRLSPQIPERLGEFAPEVLQRLVGKQSHLDFWAIHPGGRGIVDRLGEIFALAPEQLAPSRTVLRNYGNMSSPTILFVLREWRDHLRQQRSVDTKEGVAMAFGPGLVTEMAHLMYIPSTSEDYAS
jgi:predicted naringenin-chalcone synthase